jgi:hypothetical protein
MTDTEPWKSGVVREIDPGPDYQTDEDLRSVYIVVPVYLPGLTRAEYIYDCHGTCWRRLFHSMLFSSNIGSDTVGSTSMLPFDKQGVVSPELKVSTMHFFYFIKKPTSVF